MAELEAANGGRQRRGIRASHPAKPEASSGRWSRARAAARAKEQLLFERKIATGAVVGSNELAQRARCAATPVHAALRAAGRQCNAAGRNSTDSFTRHVFCIEALSAEVAAKSASDTRSLGSQPKLAAPRRVSSAGARTLGTRSWACRRVARAWQTLPEGNSSIQRWRKFAGTGFKRKALLDELSRSGPDAPQKLG